MDGPYDFEEKILAAHHRELEHQAIHGPRKIELVTLMSPSDKVVFSADPETMKDWLIANPPEGGYGIRFEPSKEIVTINDFFATY